jgi:pentatricopeptide repeat protein
LFNGATEDKTADLVTWTAMIQSLGIHGNGKEALDLYYRMLQHFNPNKITLTCVLNSCSHSGLIQEAFEIYHSMEVMALLQWNQKLTVVF